MQKIKLKKEPATDAKFQPLPFQKVAFEKIKDLEYSAIFHEQGLGKTKIAIDLMLYWFETKQIDTVIVVTKKQLISNWKSELSKHTHLTPKILLSGGPSNYYIFNGTSRVVLTNYEAVLSDEQRFELFLRTRSVAIIVDESTKIKNPDSALTKAFINLSDGFVKRVIMTGTPVANRPYDMWSQIFFLDHGQALGNSFGDFKKDMDISNNLDKDESARTTLEEKMSSIMSKISSFAVRETKKSSNICLPEKEVITFATSFEKEQESLYKQIKNEERAFVMKNGEYDIDLSDVMIKRLTRLIQVTSNPRLVDEAYCEMPGKYKILEKTVKDIVSAGEKCIIWTSFIQNVEWLNRSLEEYGTQMVHGGLPIDRREKSIQAFLNDSEVRVLVATPGSAKEGLTLTVANHAIFYDRSLSLDDYLQSQDRIHRISQKKKCYIYVINIKDSIDEWIESLLWTKELAAKLTQGDINIAEYRKNVNYGFAEIIDKILGGEE